MGGDMMGHAISRDTNRISWLRLESEVASLKGLDSEFHTELGGV